MIGDNSFSPEHRVPSTALLPYVVITFTITWGIVGFYVIRPETAVAWFGEISGSHPAFFLATWAPAFAAFFVVLRYGRAPGMTAFISRLTLWRCSASWAAFLLIGIPLLFAAGAWVKGTVTGAPISFVIVEGAVGAMVIMLFLGPVEEFGWRGLAQPILQRHMAPLWAGLLIGATWGLWHLPAFFLSGTVFSGWGFVPFFVGNVSLAVIVTPLFNASRGSILLPALFHYQLINPLWPDAQPYDTYFFVLVAIAIVWMNRDTMFEKTDAVKVVIPERVLTT